MSINIAVPSHSLSPFPTPAVAPAPTPRLAPEPTMAPPGSARSGTAEQMAAHVTPPNPSTVETIDGQRVTALWANSANLNSWFYLATAGWKRADPSTPSGCQNLTSLAACAQHSGVAPHVGHDGSGIVTSMYVW